MLFPGHGKVPTGAETQCAKAIRSWAKNLWCFGPLRSSLASLGDAWLSSSRSKKREAPAVVMDGEGGHLTVWGRGVLYGKVSGQTAAKWVGWEVGLDTPTLS